MHNLSRSHIAIQGTTAFAAVLSDRECLGGYNPAFRAGLRSATRIDFDEHDIGAFSLISQLRNDQSPRGVMHMLSEHPGCQALDIEVFDGDPAETVDQIAAELVTEIPAAIADPGVVSSQRGHALAPDLGAALASGHGALTATQPLGCALRPARTGDCLAVAQRHECGQPHVDANDVRPGAFDGFDLDVEDDEPFARLPGKDCALGLTWHFAVPAHLDFARQADDAKLARFADRQSIADAKVSGVVASGGAKAWEADLGTAPDPAEECLESLVQLAQHLLLSGAGPAALIWNVAPDDWQRHDLLVALDRDALAVSLNAVLQPGVVKPAEVAQHFAQRCGLGAVRFDPEFVREDHLPALLAFDVGADSLDLISDGRGRPSKAFYKSRTVATIDDVVDNHLLFFCAPRLKVSTFDDWKRDSRQMGLISKAPRSAILIDLGSQGDNFLKTVSRSMPALSDNEKAAPPYLKSALLRPDQGVCLEKFLYQKAVFYSGHRPSDGWAFSGYANARCRKRYASTAKECGDDANKGLIGNAEFNLKNGSNMVAEAAVGLLADGYCEVSLAANQSADEATVPSRVAVSDILVHNKVIPVANLLVNHKRKGANSPVS